MKENNREIYWGEIKKFSRHIEKKVCMISRKEVRIFPPIINEGIFLARQGWTVHLLAREGEGLPMWEKIEPFFVIQRYKLFTPRFLRANIWRPIRHFEYILKTVFWGLRQKASIYVAHDLEALLPTYIVAKLCGAKIIYRAHELWTECRLGNNIWWRTVEKLLFSKVDAVVVPNEERANYYSQKYPNAKSLILVVGNYPPYFKPTSSDRLQKYLEAKGVYQPKIVLYSGSFSPDRCSEELIESAKYLPDNVVLVLLGWGEPNYVTYLEKKAYSLGLSKRVFICPPVSYSEVMEYIASADIGVIVYKNVDLNTFYAAPNKLYDYMMMGKPIICSDFPHLKKLVEGEGIGICVNASSVNPREIADKIIDLLTDANKYQKMSQKALVLARTKFNWEIEFVKLHDLYQRLFKDVIGDHFLVEFIKYYYYLPSMALWRAIEATNLLEFKSYFREPILDLGCGNGTFSSIVFSLGAYYNIVGCDISTEAVKEAKSKKIYRDVTVCDATNLPFKNASFFTVLSNCVLEHIHDDEIVLKEVARVLKPGGKFIFTVPSIHFVNYLYYPNILKYENDHKKAESYIESLNKRLAHHHYRSLSHWNSLLKTVGLEIIHAKYYLTSPVCQIWDRLNYWATRKIGFWELHIILSSRKLRPLVKHPLKKIFVPLLRKYYRLEQINQNKKEEGGGLLIIAEKILENT